MEASKIKKVWQAGGDAGIIQTLKAMRQLIIASDATREIKTTAKKIIAGISPGNETAQVDAIFDWVQQNLKYVRDIYDVEELTQPDRIAYNINNQLDSHSSDCDDFAMLLCALLRSVGFKTRVEALAIQSVEGYDHARAAVYIEHLNGWWPLEATRPGMKPGVGLDSKKEILGLEV